MAKKQNQTSFILNPETKVELVSTKGEKAYLKVMKYEDAVKVLKGKHPTLKRTKGWVYRIYQMGFSQFKEIIKIN